MFGQRGDDSATMALTPVIWMCGDRNMGNARLPNLIAGDSAKNSIGKRAEGGGFRMVKAALLKFGGGKRGGKRLANGGVVGREQPA